MFTDEIKTITSIKTIINGLADDIAKSNNVNHDILQLERLIEESNKLLKISKLISNFQWTLADVACNSNNVDIDLTK